MLNAIKLKRNNQGESKKTRWSQGKIKSPPTQLHLYTLPTGIKDRARWASLGRVWHYCGTIAGNALSLVHSNRFGTWWHLQKDLFLHWFDQLPINNWTGWFTMSSSISEKLKHQLPPWLSMISHGCCEFAFIAKKERVLSPRLPGWECSNGNVPTS